MAGRRNILVLDAEPLVRSVVSSILEREGYSVRTCGDLQQALDAVKDSPPDLLLTNVYIPGTTGHEVAKFLRATCPEMRVLMIAGLPDDARIRERTAGDDRYDFFPKPFRASELAQKVKDMMDRTA
jgi:DNA-binding response OmpR family regulator